MKASSQNGTADYASDEIVYIPRKHIHPDPDQPRVNADAELRASIEAQGIIQAITVRPHPAIGEAFLIVDGERRYNGAVTLAEIPCRIRLDLEGDEDRLVTQITANTGKPLSPIEQARAFKKILDASEDLTQVELAKRLGVPRSTVGDRIRLLEIHPAWVHLIEQGKLQLSHAPAMHRFREVPEKYQLQAVERLLSKGTGYGLGHDIGRGEPIRIDAFESKIRDCFRPFIRPVGELPGYKGPTVELRDWQATRKYAVDPDQWKPIRNAQIKRAKEKRKKAGGGESGRESHREQRTTQQVDIERLAAAGVPVKETKKFRAEPATGEIEIFARSGWGRAIDPAALLEAIDSSSLAIRKSTDKYSSNSGIVVTTDAAAVEKARAAYLDALKKSARAACAKVLARLTPDVLEQHSVAGPGVVQLTRGLSLRGEDERLSTLALALGLGLTMEVDEYDVNFSVVTRDDAEILLSSLAAVVPLKLGLPDTYSITNPVSAKRNKTRFLLPEKTSKKQQKREARGRGEQVGDPTRAPAPRARQFEEELVGA
ncbi:MAG: ParB/RepB/Spo0J family partition protein [Gemmatimonadaceae bacterium]